MLENKSNEAYHYIECGLDNVFLYNIPIVHDQGGEQVVCIPRIHVLHKVIAQGIIIKNGLLSGKEIRFLRTEMGLKQSELAQIIGKDQQTIGRWERGENTPDKTTDILIRIMAKDILELTQDMPNPEEISQLVNNEPANDNKINIDGEKNHYSLMSSVA